MKPLSLHLQGIGPHVDTRVDFTQHKSPVALCAPMGAGKTSLIEGIFAALYGRGLWYGGSIYDFMTQGGTGKAFIQFGFEHKGECYHVERKISATEKTQTQTAHLLIEGPYDVDEKGGKWAHFDLIAGPKIADFDRAIRALVGDPESAAATWFLSQNRAGDLAGMPGDPDIRSRRRKHFHRMLGAEEIESYYGRATDALKDAESRAAEIDAQLGDVPDFEGDIEDQQHQKKMASINRDAIQYKMNETGLAHIKQMETLAQLDAGDTHHRAVIERYDVAREKAEAAARAVNDLEADIERLEALASRWDSAMVDLAELERLKKQREQARGEVAKGDAWKDWDARLRALASAAQMAGRAVRADDECHPDPTDETRALASQVDSIEGEYRAAQSVNYAAQKVNNERNKARQDLNSALGILGHQAQEYSRQIEKTPETPGSPEICGTCPLMDEFNGLAPKLIEVENKAINTMKEIEDVPADEPITDLEPIIERGQQAREAAMSIAAADSAADLFSAHKRTFGDAKSVLAGHVLKEPPKPATENPTDTLQQIQQGIDDLAGAAERLKQAEQAAHDLEGGRTLLKDGVDVALQYKVNADIASQFLNSARQALDNQASERERLDKAIYAESCEIDRLKIELTRLGEVIGHHAGQIESLERGLRETGAKRQRLQALRADAAALEDVKRCFSNQGVRQILIDDAVPELENIANRLFMLATDGRQQLRISTQRQTKAGHLAEDFAILVKDARGERDVTRYSGGQLQLIRVLLRLAVMLWHGNICGERPECLIIDEAFDGLGEDFMKLLKVLNSMASQYGQIIVVTQDKYIADRMPSRINLQWGIGGTRILEPVA